MYRGVALAFLRHEPPPTGSEVAHFLGTQPLTAAYEKGAFCLRLAGEDVRPLLRGPEVSAMASQVAALQPVRTALVTMQRALGRKYGVTPGLVVEGRDIGTVVFPDAEVKIFMTASLAVRARRRHAELLAKGGQEVTLDAIEAAIALRDQQDARRKHSPLRQARDAIVLDTDSYSMEEQVAFILARIREHALR